MANYNPHDPYGYGYQPPPAPPPSNPDPLYPSLRPSNSFTGPYDAPPRRPPANLYHSGPLPYPPPQPQYPPPQPQYPPPQPRYPPLPHYSSSFSFQSPPTPPPRYSYPETYPAPAPAPPAPPDYYPSPPTLQQHGSFHQEPFPNNSSELNFPPPHSDTFLATYGGYETSASSPFTSAPSAPTFVDNHVVDSPAASSSSSSYSSAFIPYPALPPESLVNDMHLSDPAASVSQSSCFHHRQGPGMHNGYSPQAFDPVTPISSLQQHGGGDTQIVAFQPAKTSLKVLLLHGNLDIWVYDAKNLPNLDTFSKTLSDLMGKRLIGPLNSKTEGNRFHNITSDPYVSFSVTTAVLGRTYVISNSENPVWSQHFFVPVAHYAAELQFRVKDNDFVGSELIGTVTIPVYHIYGGAKVEGTYSVLGTNGKECKKGATLRLSIQYIPVEQQGMYHQGVSRGPEFGGVPGTYFPLRSNCKVRLYQDAHVPDDCLPDLKLDHGVRYEHGKCWRDICKAIGQAQRLIYITGWSVYHKVRLVRDSVQGLDCTLGELLKSKSQEGVRVLLLVWDDPTSRSFLGYRQEGFMATHDEETRRFFKHSSVHVLLCPRSAGKRHSWMKKQEVGISYTHHQKTVIVDSDAGNNHRKIIAFVGGLDLCDGRYDTPEHPLFSTLQTLHKDDNHNPTFTGTNIDGPREPWHDLHSRIEGPAAYDVLKNFEERWLKASKLHGMKKLKKPYDDKLLDIKRIPTIMGMEQFSHSTYYDPETWDVQIFRSIDSNSVKGFPKDPKEATSKNLACGKNVLIDTSIHTAYVKAIRAAQHFIYIENQYFLGSSYNWASHKDLGANNLIPMEIALKITNKIKSNERFSAYIIIPMWPEGIPTGIVTQRILYWQNKTMEMMYEIIYKALVEVGMENKYEPQDYLNFFCLGNREALKGNSSLNPTTANAPNVLAQKARRFMIYVHSKGMIVDDEYIIVGSANINQRSLEGTRDTEIAMGSYQPRHTWASKGSSPRGQIYAYRMSLWAEHTGVVEDCFTDPQSLDCMRRMRELGEFYRRQFIADEVIEMKGHLLKYPVDVDRKGKVKPLKNWETFPDVGGNVCGSFSAVQENLTI